MVDRHSVSLDLNTLKVHSKIDMVVMFNYTRTDPW